MKKIIRKAVILLLVFVFGVVGSAFLLNSETTDDRSDMNDAVLPEIMVEFNGVYANRMCGYVQKMQADFIRDSITPIDTSKKISFVVNPYATEVKSLSYEIRTSDGSKVLENRKIKNLVKQDSYLKAEVELTCDLLMNQEYSLQITLDTKVGEVYYYTRVVSRSNVNAEQYVRFVNNFYEKCMDKVSAEDLTSYLEPLETGTATNFTDIDINSTFAEISWGTLSPKIYRSGIPVIKDINETTASVSVEYQIAALDSDGNQEIYDVAEFYRMRYTETRTMLLDFKRSATQIFQKDSIHISEKGLNLGIRDKNVEYMMNENAGIVAFVQEGDLWSYSPDDGKFSRIFSFRKESDGDFRDSRYAHDIKLIRVEDNGDVDFVLYGYMNRGIREGYCGVCVYHYSNDQNVVEEKVFIPSTESSEFLQEDLGALSYVSTDNYLFLLFAGKLYKVNLSEGISEILEDGIHSDQFAVSDTNAHAAWVIQDGEDAGNIMEIDFETLETRMLSSSEGECLSLAGFMNEDLIYGTAKEEDIVTDSNGYKTVGVHTLRIEGFDGTLKKEYHKEGFYITNITIGNTMMEFELSKKSKKGYKAVNKDNILNNTKAAVNSVSVELINSSRTGTQVRLAFDEAPEIEDALVIYAKMKSVEDRSITLASKTTEEILYYIYAKGGLADCYTDPALAIKNADELTGVVLNQDQQYVWERGNKKTKQLLNLDDIPEAFKMKYSNVQSLQEALGEEGTVMNLTGCTLEQVLYEISAQRPIIAKTGTDSWVVITGYDEYNTYLYDPETGDSYPYGMNDSTELFETAGNIFISYIETIQ